MTPMIKAPDLGVVKSLAKALRANLPETAKVSHSKALEIAANSFGFSSWHAWRSHFDRTKAGDFAPKTPESVAEIVRDQPEIGRCLSILQGEPLLFQAGAVTMQSGLSSGRSIYGFLLPLLELGARKRFVDGTFKGPLFPIRAFTTYHSHQVNAMSPLGGSDGSPDGNLLLSMYLVGTSHPKRIIRIQAHQFPVLLLSGLETLRSERSGTVVDLDRLRTRLRSAGGYQSPRITFAIPSGPLLDLTRACQAQISADQERAGGRG